MIDYIDKFYGYECRVSKDKIKAFKKAYGKRVINLAVGYDYNFNYYTLGLKGKSKIKAVQ